MELGDEILISAPRDDVYAALNDPDVLEKCIPGCEEIIRQSDTDLDAKVSLKIGPVKAKFSGSVTLSPENPPQAFSLRGEGNGGVAGFAKGYAHVTLSDQGHDTLLSYTAHADVGGKLAQLGNRLVEGTAKKLAASFFKSLAAHFAENDA